MIFQDFYVGCVRGMLGYNNSLSHFVEMHERVTEIIGFFICMVIISLILLLHHMNVLIWATPPHCSPTCTLKRRWRNLLE